MTKQNRLIDPEIHQRLLGLFQSQVKRLDAATMQLLKEKFGRKDDELWRAVFSFIYAIEDSSSSLAMLSKGLKARDCYVISRMMLELIVNTCFVLAKGIAAAKRAEKHSLQKSYRDLSRRVTVGQRTFSIEFQGRDKMPIRPDLAAALAEFTSAKGTEIRNWTDESMKSRLESIDDKFGHDISSELQLTYLAIYDKASEIAHGTIFGVNFAFGLTQPNRAQGRD
jgi:Family of unknown function (DUF5677)